MNHELKCWPEFFTPLYSGMKRFEYRKNDRGFTLGDILVIREWVPPRVIEGREVAGFYSGRETWRLVTYVLHGPNAGVPEGFCVLSIAPL